MDDPASPPDRKRRRHDSPHTLPPIRQLYLPSTDTGPSPYGLVHPGMNVHPYLPPMATEQDMMYGGGPESEDDGEQRGPPKKKRRRQALSCTECKRRKIKCDRNHPCTPCKRRGEENACQWHSIEPVEKYATKTEFDALRAQLEALKARYDQLERVVQRLLPPTTAPTLQPLQQGTYYPGDPFPGPTSGAYPSMVQSYTMDAPASGAPRYMKTEGAHSPVRPPAAAIASAASPVLPPSSSLSAQRHRLPSDSQGHPSPRMQLGSAGGGGGGKNSLAAITSPYHTEATSHAPVASTSSSSLPSGLPAPASQGHAHSLSTSSTQSKNCRAQTLKPGERLRPMDMLGEGPGSTTAAVVAAAAVSARVAAADRSLGPDLGETYTNTSTRGIRAAPAPALRLQDLLGAPGEETDLRTATGGASTGDRSIWRTNGGGKGSGLVRTTAAAAVRAGANASSAAL